MINVYDGTRLMREATGMCELNYRTAQTIAKFGERSSVRTQYVISAAKLLSEGGGHGLILPGYEIAVRRMME